MNNEVMPPPGERLRLARQCCEMTQRELARSLGVSHVTVGEWERGVRPIPAERAKRLERMFEITLRPEPCPQCGEPLPARVAPQNDDADIVARVTSVVREADEAFQKSGGGSRHWVRDQFLPRLNAAGLVVVASPLHGKDGA